MALLEVLPASASAFPWIGCIRSTFPSKRIGGTGSLIAPTLVLTAAHILYDPVTREKVQSAEVTFGGPGRLTVTSTKVDFPREWAAPASSLDNSLVSPYDIGVIVLPHGIDRHVTPATYQTASDAMLAGMSISVGGYPVHPDVVHGTLYGRNTGLYQDGALGAFARYEPWRLFYPVATHEGISGGPVYDVDPVSNTRTVRGVHTSRLDSFAASALRINEDIFRLIQHWATTFRP